MAIDNRFMVRKIQARTKIFVPFCAYTNMPLLVCDPDTGNDQVYIFENEKLLQEFAKTYTERKILLRGVVFPNKDFLRFYSSLLLLGVNELVFVDSNGKITMELETLIKKPDYSKLDPKMVPVTNPNLQLTGIYFMQEAARPVPNEEKEELKDLEEELAANMVKGRYILAVELPEGPESDEEKLKGKQFRLPLLKDKDGNAYQPAFTDPLEFEKFNKNKKFKAIAVPFSELIKLLAKDTKGYMLNPNGYHIVMPRELLQNLPKRFQ